MTEELAQYAKHFHDGGRVRVGVPLDGGGVFAEWGVVASLEHDLLELDLSRDALPEHARLELGRTLDLGLPSAEQGALSCRGVLVGEEPHGHRLVLRLIEEVVPFEPREFFRQDVYLPLDYRRPPSQVAEEVKARWQRCRLDMEFAAQSPEPGEPEELDLRREEIRARLDQQKTAPPVAANISGGGVRLNITEKMREGQLVELSIYLPHPPRVLEIVGEVVQVSPLPDEMRFSTAMHYRFIDEADRDRLIGYISAQQLLQLSQQGPRVPVISPGRASAVRRRLAIAIGLALLAAFIGCQVRAIVAKKESGEKWEVQRVFDEGIRKYLRQRQ